MSCLHRAIVIQLFAWWDPNGNFPGSEKPERTTLPVERECDSEGALENFDGLESLERRFENAIKFAGQKLLAFPHGGWWREHEIQHDLASWSWDKIYPNVLANISPLVEFRSPVSLPPYLDFVVWLRHPNTILLQGLMYAFYHMVSGTSVRPRVNFLSTFVFPL